MSVGKMLRKLRMSKGLTLAQLSEMTGYSVSHLSEIERDKSGLLVDKLHSICVAMDESISTLFFMADDHLTIHPVLNERESPFLTVGDVTVRKSAVHIVVVIQYYNREGELNFNVLLKTARDTQIVFRGTEQECKAVASIIRERLWCGDVVPSGAVILGSDYYQRLLDMAKKVRISPENFIRNMLDYSAYEFGFQQLGAWDEDFQTFMEGGDPFDADWSPPDGSNLAI